MKVLIIEDEIKAARELQRILLEADPDIEITGMIDSVEAGTEYLLNNPPPDLIFSDIQLADGMCFEIFNKVAINSPIIFCTAFDEYMPKAFDTNAVSYVLKPITAAKIQNALAKYHQLKAAFEPARTSAAIDHLSRQLKYPYKTALLVDHRDKIIPLPVKEIAAFYLDRSGVKIITFQNTRYIVSSTLDELERVLDPALFYRANRQFIINRPAIVSAEKHFSRKLSLKLQVDTEETIVVSKAKASDFLQWLAGEH